jgi:hypothetical protein
MFNNPRDTHSVAIDCISWWWHNLLKYILSRSIVFFIVIFNLVFPWLLLKNNILYFIILISPYTHWKSLWLWNKNRWENLLVKRTYCLTYKRNSPGDFLGVFDGVLEGVFRFSFLGVLAPAPDLLFDDEFRLILLQLVNKIMIIIN